MLKTFLKPGWVLLLIFVVTFSYFAFTVLAPWQLGKDDRIVERNHLIAQAYEADPRPLSEVVDSEGAIADDEWSRATLHGRYLADEEVLLRLRPVSSGAVYQSLVPFRTDSGLTMLVNRGWIAAGEGNTVPSIPKAPAGETTIVGMIRADEPKHASAPIDQEGYEQVYSIHTEEVASLTDTKLGHDYIQLSPEQPGELTALEVPQLDRGNHLSYGYQWIAFGIMAPLGLGYFVWSEIRERRRAREEEAALQAATSTDGASAPTAGPGSAADSALAAGPSTDSTKETTEPAAAAESTPRADTTPSRRSRSRYGDSNPDFYEKIRERGQERF